MSWRRLAVLATAWWLVSSSKPAEAQRQRFVLWGGAGLSTFYHPELSLSRAGTVGGFIGLRFNDNLSVEGGVSWARSDRRFAEDNIPIEDANLLPAFEFKTTRYHLDGAFVYHIGRRQPFNPYVLGGAGMVRREERRTDFEFDPETLELVGQTLVLDTVETEPAFFAGAGFDLYFKYNLAARVEFRWWFPMDTDRGSRMFLFGGSYFF